MIPPTIDESTVSSGEVRVFRLLRDAPGTEDWVCLHSLGLARHPTKRKAEIDFLVVTPKAALVLEVKAGRVARKDGVWTYTNRYGVTSSSREGPFKQASSAMFALEGELRKQFGSGSRLGRLMIGYGVVLPDIEFTANGPEDPREIVYDRRDARDGMVAFIRRLTSFHFERNAGSRYAPTAEDVKDLVRFLRGDFEPLSSLAWSIQEASAKLVAATEEQYEILDLLRARPRLLVEGGAGTGKTVLATESARRARAENRRTGLVVFNRSLAAVLKRMVAGPLIQVASVHNLFSSTINASSLRAEFEEQRGRCPEKELFERLLPEYAQLAWLESGPRFDELILDEAQDYLSDRVLDALDACLDGGLEAGRWRMFLDSNNQGSVYGQLDDQALTRAKRLGETHLLMTNCRNTFQINDEAEKLSAPAMPTRARVAGPPVAYHFYSGRAGQEKKLREIVETSIREGVSPGTITVLSPVRTDAAAVATSGLKFRVVDEDMAVEIAIGHADSVSASTCSAFKGLENDFVILTDVSDLEGDWAKATLYVGMTRARVKLVVLLEERLRAVYEKRIQAAIRRQLESQGEGE